MLLLLSLACTPDAPADPSSSEPCADPWAGLDVEGALHVGEGQPYERIQQAVEDAGDGATIAVHGGTYDGGISSRLDDLTLVGECRDRVVVADDSAADVIDLLGARAQVAGMNVQGGKLYGILFGGADATLREVDLVDTTGNAAGFAGGTNTVSAVSVVRQHCLASLASCSGLNEVGGRLEVEDLLVEDAEGPGIVASDGATVDVGRSVFREARAGVLLQTPAVEAIDADIHLADGVEITRARVNAVMIMNGTLSTEGAVRITETTTMFSSFEGAVALYAGSRLDVGPGLEISNNQGPAVLDGGARSVVIAGATFSGNCRVDDRAAAVTVYGHISIDVQDTTITHNGCGGVAFSGTPTLSDLSLEDNRGVGVELSNAHATLTRVEVRGTGSGPTYEGIGVLVTNGSELSATTLAVHENADAGLVVHQSRATVDGLAAEGNAAAALVGIGSNLEVDAADLVATLPADERDWGGYGVFVARVDSTTPTGETLSPPSSTTPDLLLRGSTVTGSARAGVVAAEGTWVSLDTVRVEGTAATGDEGDGAQARAGARLDLSGVSFSGNARTSALYDGATGTLDGSSGDEAGGLVQQHCETTTPLVITGSDFADTSLCTDAPPLPLAATPFTWTNDLVIGQ